MRKLASIKLIDDVLPIEKADRLEQAVIGGWHVVVAKGQFKKGDKCLYIEIDSAIPSEDKRFEFLHERCLKRWMNHGELILETVRIKTIKLRGVISQGLAMPLDEFPELKDNSLGDDVTEILKIQHYDDLAEKCGRIQGVCKIAGNAKGNFPVYITDKSDEERIQNLSEYFDGRFEEEEFEVTEKFDGSSATYIYAPNIRKDDPFFVCSRNLELKDEEGNLYWNISRKYDILAKLKKYSEDNGNIDIAIQGEIVGPGVNSNRDQYEDHEFRVFRMFDATNRKHISPKERQSAVLNMGLLHVKVIKNNFKAFKELKTMEGFLEFVKGKTDRGHEREGMVFKSVNNGEIHFKVINNDYLLKQKD